MREGGGNAPDKAAGNGAKEADARAESVDEGAVDTVAGIVLSYSCPHPRVRN